MYTKTITVLNAEGLHMRPAQMLTETASKFSSDATLKTGDGEETSARSVLGIIALGLGQGTVVTIEAEGADEEQAVKALAELFEEKFGEANE